MLTIDGIYDGQVVHLLSNQPLPPNRRVKVMFEEQEEPPILGEDHSFLKLAMKIKKRGPSDFSEKLGHRDNE